MGVLKNKNYKFIFNKRPISSFFSFAFLLDILFVGPIFIYGGGKPPFFICDNVTVTMWGGMSNVIIPNLTKPTCYTHRKLT